MEIELEPRVNPLGYKVKGMSRESLTQKATNVIDPDLRSHWSTATNNKEWILLELDEPCLLSHIKIYNKSVLEWEIAVGLRYKPEAFVKVRLRCEAPRREMVYPTNYTPCRYVRISCLRGNPIALFFIQLIGVSVPGLEPEFQPVVNYLLPHIISHKQDIYDMYLQLLQGITRRLLVFLPQLEADLMGFPDAAEFNIRFLAMLAGPLYPILHVVKERDTTKLSGSILDIEASKSSLLSPDLTVSSNFEPRRPRSTTTPFSLPTSSSTVFRPDMVMALLRKAYKDSNLKTTCKIASRIMQKLIEPSAGQDTKNPSSEPMSSVLDESTKYESVLLVDYSNLFGDEFQIPDDARESNYLNVLDIRAVEEGILHILYGCASQPQLCSKLAGSTSDFWSALPLVQALLPALRPSVSSPDRFDDNFSQWKQPLVLKALSQIVGMSSSLVYRSLLHACAGYLASFSLSHAKAACVLIDLCSGVLASWMIQAIAKIDLTMELFEDLLSTIQGARYSLSRARAALKYIVLALSGHMDDILSKYKEVKHKILFLVEMFEPFLNPIIAPLNSTISFGDVSPINLGKQDQACVIALKVIRIAVEKSAVLPSLESEWRHGSVAPSVLLSILEPHMQLPPDIDLCKSSVSKVHEQESSTVSSISLKSSIQNEQHDGKTDLLETLKMNISEDASSFFAPSEIKSSSLAIISTIPDNNTANDAQQDPSYEEKNVAETNIFNQFQNGLVLDAGFAAKFFNLQADHLQLVNYSECEIKASEFRRLALDLHSENEVTFDGHDAAIDALLLAAECYINPFFTMSFRAGQKVINMKQNHEMKPNIPILKPNMDDLENLSHLEIKRDRIVLQILLEAAELDKKYLNNISDREKKMLYYTEGSDEKIINLIQHDVQVADAVTLIRQNQTLLFEFLIQRLQKKQHSMHETLMQCLLLLLHFSTRLFCPPEVVIDIILSSAEYLNEILTSYYHQLNEGNNLQLDQEKVLEVQRRWMLLQNMVIASSGGDEGQEQDVLIINKGVRCGNLIPPSAWMHKIYTFSTSAFPLVRYIGWMAVSRNAKQYLKEQLFLASDLSEMTSLLCIFADELSLVEDIVNKNDKTYENQNISFCVYPDLGKFFPEMRKQFKIFGEIILEAVGYQLRSLSSSVVPDLLCWFSDLCLLPFVTKNLLNNSDNLKGYCAKNAKAIILYIFEAIVVEHMEAMVPEIPRVVQVLVSLCRVSYCDVSFLSSMLHLVKPVISYSLRNVSDEEKMLVDDDLCPNFETLCFDELFNNIRHKTDETNMSKALPIFILASMLPDLSFQRRRDFLQSLHLWADFSSFEPTTFFHDYLFAFQCVIQSFKLLLLQTLKFHRAFPSEMDRLSDNEVSDDNSEFRSWILNDFRENLENGKPYSESLVENFDHIPAEEICFLCENMVGVIYKLYRSMGLCWKFHHQLAKKLTLTASQCFIYSKCLLSIIKEDYKPIEDESKSISFDSIIHWKTGFRGLAEITVSLQENSCWEVVLVMLDCLLGAPSSFFLDSVLDCICSLIKKFCISAPKIDWRLQTDKWLSVLFTNGRPHLTFDESDGEHLIGLFFLMLGHPEPEQRFIALKHLERLVSQEVNGGLTFAFCNKLASAYLVTSNSELNLLPLISSTWDQVIVLASSDPSLMLKTHAMIVLLGYIPYAERHKIQSFLAGADSVVHGLGKHSHPNCGGALLQLSLALIASACLYSPSEDIKLIPLHVWKSIETLAMSKAKGGIGEVEKKTCQALCRLRNEEDEAKEVLKEVLSSCIPNQVNTDFQGTRASILQVISDLTSVRSYFETFSEKVDQDAIELEEAEIELDILRKDSALKEPIEDNNEGNRFSSSSSYMKDGSRLQQIKDAILSLEKSKIREEIISRKEKKVLARRTREKFLEEGALREAELLRELDRERMIEVEKEIERQHILEQERAKSRELRHNLDMEKERVAQIELQREIEQAESGLRTSRRDFPSSTHNRPRDRFRDRDNIRSGTERPVGNPGGNFHTDPPFNTPAMVLTGNRAFSGYTPTILQSRDRLDDSGSNYDENLDGSKDSGDTGSVGDPESISAFDGAAQRHGSRGSSKSKQILDRRDRDSTSRHEGKWERKHF